MTIDDVKVQILQFLANRPQEQFRPDELARRLSLKGSPERQLLQQALNELAESKAIGRFRRKRFGYARPRLERTHNATGILNVARGGVGLVRLLPPGEGTIAIAPQLLGTALTGDTVKVTVFARPTGNLRRRPDAGPDIPEGEIVEIVKRSQRSIVGVFQKSKNFFFVVPDDSRIGRDIYIPKGKTRGARPGEKVVSIIEQWESRSQNPEGRVTEILGRSGEVRAEMASVAREFQLPLSFPREVSAEADRISPTIEPTELGRRLDLRERICFTIDPEDAKDFDDAVSLEELPGGDYMLGVHIADVSHYVREGTALDREAYARGTSVYLADEVIPMLPEKLSNELCSLRPGTDRLTYSVLITVSPRKQGVAEKDYRISRSVIHSKRRFSYEEVQKIIETRHGPFSDVIGRMHSLSQGLLAKRLKEGSIDFETAETKFRFDEKGAPAQIIKKLRLDAHRLVEEFMLLANQTVARHIGLRRTDGHVRPFLYRVHDQPPPEKLADLASFVEHLGYSLSTSGGLTPRALQKLLKEVHGTEEEDVVNEVAIRSMAKAVYSEKNTGHFGLGFQYYTHFTSPIRRYPDLVVHRLLREYEGKMPSARRQRFTESLPEICQHSTERERVAMEAERASVRVMQVEYMKRHLGDEFHAIISGVTHFGLFVEISDLLVEGLIRVRDMEDDYYVHDEKRFALTGRRTKKRYRLGDKVTIRVVRVDPEEREIDFALVGG